MKALVLTGDRQMDYRDMPAPEPGEGASLIGVEAVGICGSDMHAWLGHDPRRPAPLILGHEAAGHVTAGALKGRRVTVNPLVTCGTCPACRSGRDNICPDRQIISMPPREGAFAQQLVMPAGNLVAVPDHVDICKAALAEPLAVCWHAAKLGRRALRVDLPAARCLVQGGGAIGIGSALCLRALGAREIDVAEPNALRHGALRKAGFTVCHPADAGGAYDLILDAVGIAPTRRAASAAAAPGGVIVHVGLGDAADALDTRRITLQEIAFLGSYCYTRADFRETAQGIFEGRFGDLDWVEERALSDGAAAFAQIHDGSVAAPKVILRP